MPSNNEDSLIGQNIGKQGFSISGTQFGIPGEPEGGKTPTTAAPMAINNQHAGLYADEDSVWKSTFGSSLDSYLTLYNGTFLRRSIDEMNPSFISAGGGIFKEAMTNAEDDNLYDKINGVQQIQYVASKDTASDGADSLDDFGGISEARGLGIRLPMMAAGWGRKVNLLPTDPSPSEDENGRKNDGAHKLDRASWKHGPVDLRWDPIRGVWTAFNDMIADHQEVGIGTWLHGTNSLAEGGFPFVRGKLEDLIWVRKTKDTEDNDPLSDTDSTAKSMIHLEARFFDEQENGSAPLSSIFCVPHRTTSDFHNTRPETSLGEEITGEDLRIDIKSRVHFINEYDKEMDGPIFFNNSAPIIEENYGNEAFYFAAAEEQNEIIGFHRFDRQSGSWVVATPIEECELVGNHFKSLVENDARVAVESARVLAKINEFATNTKNTINGIAGALAGVDSCIIAGINNYGNTINNGLTAIQDDTTSTFDVLAETINTEVNAAFTNLVSQLTVILLECCGAASIISPTISVTAAHGGGITIGSPGIACSLGTVPGAPGLDEEFNVHLNGPCQSQSDYLAGTTQMNPNIQTEKGNAQFDNPNGNHDYTPTAPDKNQAPDNEINREYSQDEKLSTNIE